MARLKETLVYGLVHSVNRVSMQYIYLVEDMKAFGKKLNNFGKQFNGLALMAYGK